MTHEGRMARGEENFKKGFLNNADTTYFLNCKPQEEPKKEVEEKPKESKPKSKEKKKDARPSKQ